MSLPFRLPRAELSRSAARDARLHPYVALVVRYWAVVLIATVVGALVGYGLSQLVTPTYTARSSLYFSIGYGDSGSDLNQGGAYAQGQMLSFAELATTERVLQPVITELGLTQTLAQLASQISVTTPSNTVVLDVAATSVDPEQAAAIANAVAQHLTDTVQDVAPRNEDGKATVAVRTVQTADPPTTPAAPNTLVNVVAAALIALVLSLLAIIALRLLDTRLRDGNGIASAGGLPVLARLRISSGVAFAADPASAVAEDYRRLVATLDAVETSPHTTAAKRARVFVLASVTSARHDAEHATSAVDVGANLALAASEAGHRVVLVTDAPLELPGGEENLVTLRGIPANGTLPAAVLSAHDLVLVAAPGAADGSRTLRLGKNADGVVLLADEGRVHIGELRASIDLLRTAGAQIAGTVLTGLPSDERHAAPVDADRPARFGLRRPLPVVLEHHEA